MTKIRVLIAAGAVAAIMVLPGIANAQYPPATPVPTAATCAQLNDSTPNQGQSVAANGQPGCFTAGENVTGTVESDPVVVFRTTATANGSYSATFTVPASIPAGTHTFRVVGATSGLQYARPIVVQAATGTTAGVGLPRTGADILALAMWALLAIGGGSFLIAASWKKYRLSHVEAQYRAPKGAPPALASIDNAVEAPRPVIHDEPVQASTVTVADEPVAVQETIEPEVVSEWAPQVEQAPVAEAPIEEVFETEVPDSEVGKLVGQLRQEIDAWTTKR